MTEKSGQNEPPFPMRINSIEKFHLFDDSEAFPNNLFCRFRFKGRLDRIKTVEAIRFFESRHPLVRAMVESTVEAKNGSNSTTSSISPTRWTEVPEELLPSNTIVMDEGLPDTGPFSFDVRPLDLTAGCGLRIYIRQFEQHVEAAVQVHHAVFDGGGGIQIINDWMTAYNNLLNGKPVETGARKLTASQLKDRNKLGLTSWSYLKHLYKQPVGLFGATKFLLRSFTRICDESEPQTIHENFPVIAGCWVEPQKFSGLRAESERLGVHLNSVLLARLFLAVDTFRKQTNANDPDAWIRIIVPMSVRDVADRRLSAANRSAVVQVDRRRREFDDEEKLTRLLNREVGVIRIWQLSKLFLIAVRSMSMVTPWLKSSAQNTKSRGTLIFTNLGNPFSRNRNLHSRADRTGDRIVDTQIGDVSMQHFDLCGPIKPGTPINISVQEHGTRLRVSMHYDPRQIAPDDATRILDLYSMQLRK